jgi:elongation factor Ts
VTDAIKELRERTGAGFLDCKKALTENGNNMDKAIEFLRQKGLAAAVKKAGRAANQGLVHSYIHAGGKIGVLVEVNCETDFVANTDEYRAFVTDVAMHIAAANPRFLNKEQVTEADLEKEKAVFRAHAEASGKKGPVIDKIIEGKMGKFYEEVCLVNQRFVKDPDKTIEDLVKGMIAKLGENIAIRRFARFQLGEGVAAQA